LQIATERRPKTKTENKASQVRLGQEQSRSEEQLRRTSHKSTKRHPTAKREAKKTRFPDDETDRTTTILKATS